MPPSARRLGSCGFELRRLASAPTTAESAGGVASAASRRREHAGDAEGLYRFVDDDGDVCTVKRRNFARTYRPKGTGTYVEVGAVWTRRVERAGAVTTREGTTHDEAGA